LTNNSKDINPMKLFNAANPSCLSYKAAWISSTSPSTMNGFSASISI
jgi:hypothetical protein